MRMAKAVKRHGRVYTPDYLVKTILDFGGYNGNILLKKHVIDNSCGDGAFLKEIVHRYCSTFLSEKKDISELKLDLETYIHGIELDLQEKDTCISNLNQIAEKYGIQYVNWDILNADTLTIDNYNGRMDFVFGNPPYVRVHNLADSYNSVKKFRFAEGGMTDLYIVFFRDWIQYVEGGWNNVPNHSQFLVKQCGWQKPTRFYLLSSKYDRSH